MYMYMYTCMHTMQIQSSRAKHNSVTIPPKIKLVHFKLMIMHPHVNQKRWILH